MKEDEDGGYKVTQRWDPSQQGEISYQFLLLELIQLCEDLGYYLGQVN